MTINVYQRKNETRDDLHERAKRAACRAVSTSKAAVAFTWREDSHARDGSTAIYQTTIARKACSCGRHRRGLPCACSYSVLGEVWVILHRAVTAKVAEEVRP
jgi:hypothetical protein